MGFLDDLPEGFSGQIKNKKQPPPIPGAVIYQPVKCPKCRSKKVPVYNTVTDRTYTVRYHKCKDCGFNFKSVEK